VLRLAVGEQLLHGGVTTLHASSANGIVDDGDLGLDFLVLTVLVGKGSENRVGLIDATMGQKPSRRLGKSQHQDKNHEGKGNLEGNRESPDEGVRSVGATIINPVGNQGTDGDVTTFDANELSTVVCSRTFSLVSGDSRCVDTVTNLEAVS
jgi:hypothetical protein